MRQTAIALLTLFVIWSSGSSMRAQDAKGSGQKSPTPAANQKMNTTAADEKTADQKSTTEPTNNAETPNEVDKMIAEAKQRGDLVVGTMDASEKDSDRPLNESTSHVIRLPKPAYPPLARAAHIQGVVNVRVLIDFDGKVIAAAAVSGHPLLYGVCVQAARQAEFTPTKLDGQPVKVTGVLQYNFVAQ